MRLELNSPVRCTDGPFGELADVVIDPTTRHVTHVVIAPRHHHGLARLAPIGLVDAEDGSAPALALRCTVEEALALDPVQDFAYVRWGEFPHGDPNWDVGIETVLAQPYYGYSGIGGDPIMDLDPHVSIVYDRIPKHEVEIRRRSDVFSADEHRLGHVDGFVVDGDDGITHLVLGRGHLFGRRDVTIPIGAVARVATDTVTLDLTKDDVERLPSVPLHRWAA